MPKVKETKNRIIVHVGDAWKTVDKWKKGYDWATHDVGKKGFTQRIAVRAVEQRRKRGEKWQTYAWSFTKKQVALKKRSLTCHDKSSCEILGKMHDEGDLKGYALYIEEPEAVKRTKQIHRQKTIERSSVRRGAFL